MEIAKVTSNSQVTVPKAVKEKLELEAGSKIVFLQVGDEMVVRNAESIEHRAASEDSAFYRIPSDALPAFHRLQEAFSGFAEEEGLETEDDVVEWVKRLRRNDDQ